MSSFLMALRPESQELQVVLAYLRALSVMHQTHHWQSLGDTSYSDHLLFERLYDALLEEIDSVAERCVGKEGVDSVNPSMQLRRQFRIVKELCGNFEKFTNPRDLVESSLRGEMSFLVDLSAMRGMMESRGALSNGIANLLDDIADHHESHVYLLEQRLGGYVGAVKLALSKEAGPYGPSTDEQEGDDWVQQVKTTEAVVNARADMLSARDSLIDAKQFASPHDAAIIRNTITSLSRAISSINPLV